MAGDGPKFLVDDGPAPTVDEEPPTTVEQPVGPTPEQRAAIEAVLAGTSAAACVHCKTADCAPVYLVLSHDQFTHERRFRFTHGSEPVRQPFAPHVTMMCTPCYRRVDGMRTLATRMRWRFGAGLVVACGYVVGGLAHAPSAIVLTLLFGGMGIMAVCGVLGYSAAKDADSRLPLPSMLLGGDLITVIVSRDRTAIAAFLDKNKLAFLDPTELDRLVAREKSP